MADWYAFEEVENALDRTREILLPFDLGTWTRLLILVIFTSSGLNIPGGPGTADPGSNGNDFSQTSSNLDGDIHQAAEQPLTGFSSASPSTSVVAIAAFVILSVVTLWFLISSVMSLVYYQSLLDNNVRIRSNFRKHFNKGLSYLGFQIAVFIGIAMIIGIPLLVMTSSPIIGGLLLIPLLPLLALVVILLGLTDNFVLPRMIEENENVLKAWKSVYTDLKSEWRQVGVYVVVRLALKILGGMLSIFWVILTLLAALVVFGLIAVPFYLVAEQLVVIPLVVGVIAWLLAAALIQIPVQTYLNYYALLVYHRLTS